MAAGVLGGVANLLYLAATGSGQLAIVAVASDGAEHMGPILDAEMPEQII